MISNLSVYAMIRRAVGRRLLPLQAMTYTDGMAVEYQWIFDPVSSHAGLLAWDDPAGGPRRYAWRELDQDKTLVSTVALPLRFDGITLSALSFQGPHLQLLEMRSKQPILYAGKAASLIAHPLPEIGNFTYEQVLPIAHQPDILCVVGVTHEDNAKKDHKDAFFWHQPSSNWMTMSPRVRQFLPARTLQSSVLGVALSADKLGSVGYVVLENGQLRYSAIETEIPATPDMRLVGYRRQTQEVFLTDNRRFLYRCQPGSACEAVATLPCPVQSVIPLPDRKSFHLLGDIPLLWRPNLPPARLTGNGAPFPTPDGFLFGDLEGFSTPATGALLPSIALDF